MGFDFDFQISISPSGRPQKLQQVFAYQKEVPALQKGGDVCFFLFERIIMAGYEKYGTTGPPEDETSRVWSGCMFSVLLFMIIKKGI